MKFQKIRIIRFGVQFALLVLIITGAFKQVDAGMIIASGDATPAFYAADPDNNVFFTNVLGSGNSVIIHDQNNPTMGNKINTFFNSLSGVTSDLFENETVTSSMLSGVDLFVTSLNTDQLAVTEIDVLDIFLDDGGTVLFMGDYVNPETRINNALAGLGSAMRLDGILSAAGTYFAGVDSDPLTSGVSSFTYGYTYGVTGGTSLFRDENNRTFMAYEGTTSSVPEPSTLILMGVGLITLLIKRKRSII